MSQQHPFAHIRCGCCTRRKAPLCTECDRLRAIEARKPRPCQSQDCSRHATGPQGKYCAPCRDRIQKAIGKRLAKHSSKPVPDLTPELIDAAFERARKQQRYENWLAAQAARKGRAA